MTGGNKDPHNENQGAHSGPDTPSMENVLELLRLSRPPQVMESPLNAVDELEQISEELTKELAGFVRNILIDNGFLDAGAFEAEDVQRLGFDICNDAEALEKLISIAKNNASVNQLRIDDLIRARDEVDYELTQRELTDAAYGLMRWVEIIDEDELYQLRISDDFNDKRNLQKFARLIVSPAMTQLLSAMQKTVERAGRKFAFKEAMAMAWNRARALDREQAALDAGDAQAIERRRKLLGSSVMEEAQRELLTRSEHEVDRLPDDFPHPDEG